MDVAITFIAFFAAVFGIMYIHYTTRNKERMALIEKGADASLFNTGKEGKTYVNWNRFTLKAGMFFVGIGLGVIAGALLSSLDLMPAGPDYVSMIFLFGGLSLILFYIFERKNK